MIKLIAFDMDGTLTDSGRLIVTYINKTLAHYGRPALPAGQILRHVGHGGRNLLLGVMQESGFSAEIEEIFAVYDALYQEDPSGLVTAYGGVREMLQTLGSRKIRRVVLSNRPHNQTLLICGAVLPDCLDEIYGQRPGIPMKPDPTALQMILKENGIQREECLYMGDMHYDVDVARNAGVRSVGCVWGLGGEEQVQAADFVIHAPMELIGVIEKLNKEEHHAGIQI